MVQIVKYADMVCHCRNRVMQQVSWIL